jgi:pSer/pThr/pTyr-binding forkhead associated (FHA) protein
MVLSEPTVSRQHALLIAADANRECIIRNLSRTNPTFVNDRAVQETRLRPGDRIRIGNSLIGYESTVDSR